MAMIHMTRWVKAVFSMDQRLTLAANHGHPLARLRAVIRHPFRVATCLLAMIYVASLGAFAVSAQEQSDAATRQYAAAVALQNREVFDLAADEWTKFVEMFPSDERIARAWHYLGVCQSKNQQYEPALASFRTVIEKFPQFELMESTLLQQGVTQYSLGQQNKPEFLEQAQVSFEQMIAKYPESKYLPQAMFYVAEVMFLRGQKESAVAKYAEVISRFPAHDLLPDVYYALGTAQEELGKFAEAEATYGQFTQRFSQHALANEVWLRIGESQFNRKDYASAEATFNNLLRQENFPFADLVLLRLGDCQLERKAYADAAGSYAKLVRSFPQSKYIRAGQVSAGKCSYMAGQFDGAVQILTTLAESGDAEACHWCALSLLKQNQTQAAMQFADRGLASVQDEAMRGVLSLDRANALFDTPGRAAESLPLFAEIAQKHANTAVGMDALYMAAFGALSQKQYDQALAHGNQFLQAYADKPLVPDILHVLGESHLQLKQYPEAETAYRRVVGQYPNFAEAARCQLRIGLVLYLQKKHNDCVTHLTGVMSQFTVPDLVAEANYLVGLSYFALDQAQPAAQSLYASLNAQPKWRQADECYLALANAYRKLNDNAKAKQTLEAMLNQFPDSLQRDKALYRLGEIAYAAGDFEAAMANYGQLIQNHAQSPLVPNAMYGQAWSMLSKGDSAAAKDALSKLLAAYPNHELARQAQYARAVALQQEKKPNEAIPDLQAFLAGNPGPAEKADALYLLGVCQGAGNDHASAIETFRKLLTEIPDYGASDKVLYELAWSLKSTGQEGPSADTFKLLSEKYPDSPLVAEALFHTGEQAYAAQDFAAAAKSYYASMNKAGNNASLGEKAVHKLGWAYYRQQKFDHAAQTFSAQRTSFPQGELASDGAFMQGECLFELQKFQEALSSYAQVTKPTKPDFQVLALLHGGQAAAQLKDWNKSLEMLRQCSTAYPDSDYLPEVLYEQAWATQNLGKPDEALKIYEEVTVKTNREVAARARFMIGEIFFEKKDHKEAVRHFFQVAFSYAYPTWQAAAHYESGRCFEVLQKPKQAIESYQELVDKFPNSDKAPLAKERLAALKGQ